MRSKQVANWMYTSLVGLITLFSTSAFAVSNVQLVPAEQMFQAGAIHYKFQLINGGTQVTNTQLATDNGIQLHFFVYDTALATLVHVHPLFDGTNWAADLNLPQNDTYWVWANGTLTEGNQEFYASTRAMIMGGSPENTSVPHLTDVRTGTDGNSKIWVAPTSVVAGNEVMLMTMFSRTDGTQSDIQPYLGEMGHAIIVSSDETVLVHAHLMLGSMGMLMLHATFPNAGNYRVWVQYSDGGVLRTVPLAMKVNPPPTPAN